MSDCKHIYYSLDYNHEELEMLLDKIHDGYVLSKEQYDKLCALLEKNVSDFSGDYEDLKNLPTIPQMMSELENDMKFQTAEEVNEKLIVLKENIMEEIGEVSGVQGPQGDIGPEGPVGPQGPQGPAGVFDIEMQYSSLKTENKDVIGAINELLEMVKKGVIVQPEEPGEVPAGNEILYGYIPYDEQSGTIEYSDIFYELIKEHENMNCVEVKTMDKTSLGIVPMGALIVIAVPEKCENFDNLVVMKDNGFGGKVAFDEEILGVNGMVVDFNGVNFKLYGEMLLTDAEIFFYIDNIQ